MKIFAALGVLGSAFSIGFLLGVLNEIRPELDAGECFLFEWRDDESATVR